MIEELKSKIPKEKPPEVQIKSISSAVVPTNMSTISIINFGLGDDNLVYQWDGKKKAWVI